MKRPEKIVLMYEVTRNCNCRCLFCYNTWKLDADSGGRIAGDRGSGDRGSGELGRGELGTSEALAMLDKAIDETRCTAVTLSGGEPLLRRDIGEIIAFIKGRGVGVSLVTNGALMTDEKAGRLLDAGVDRFQITLLSDDRDLHNRLSGCDIFERALEAVLCVAKRGGAVSTFFVGLAESMKTFPGTLELNALLGVRTVALGRFVPGGAGLAGWEAHMPSPEAIDEALAAGEEVCARYGMTISISTPIPPCLNDLSAYPHVRPSFCGVGNPDLSLFCIDPAGNLKVCSHSPVPLGNIIDEPFDRLLSSEYLDRFIEAVPEFCRDCPDVGTCRGGCRSAAHLVGGSPSAEDPYLSRWKGKARKGTRSRSGAPEDAREGGCQS